MSWAALILLSFIGIMDHRMRVEKNRPTENIAITQINSVLNYDCGKRVKRSIQVNDSRMNSIRTVEQLDVKNKRSEQIIKSKYFSYRDRALGTHSEDGQYKKRDNLREKSMTGWKLV